jgi:predicted Rossmann fold flavoprotein
MMCALTAGRRGRRVLLIEHLEQPGAKILISGGGRCNFTNLEISPERFLSANPNFCRSALSRFTQYDFIAMVERHRIPYHEKTLGQLFCDRSASEIVSMLMEECTAAEVDLRLGVQVGEITKGDRFRIQTSGGVFEGSSLVIATGGLSIPKMGATGFAYDLARRFGLSIVEPRPGLAPMKMSGEVLALCKALTGVSADAIVTCGKISLRENLLFTHRGFSGPAILQISSYWSAGESIAIDLLPEVDAEKFLRDRRRTRPRAEVKTVLGELLPTRLADSIASSSGSIANLADQRLMAIATRLNRWRVIPLETEGWAKAEVTAGGIDSRALWSRTMEARDVPGLFFIGEAVDVTGWLGGYNFQWAWSSGWCAGEAA